MLTLINEGLGDDPSDFNDYIPCVTENLKFLTHHLDDMSKGVCHCNCIICISTFDREENIILLNPSIRELKIVSNAGRQSCCDKVSA